MGMGAFLYAKQKSQLEKALTASLDGVSTRLSNNLPSVVWDMYKDQALNQLMAEMAAPDITAIVVKGDKGDFFSGTIRRDGKPEAMQESTVLPRGTPLKSLDLRRAGRSIGKGEIYYSYDNLNERLVDQTIMTGVVIVVVDGVMSVILLIILWSLVTRPIGELTRMTREIVRTGDLSQSVTVASREEVGMLADSFQQMIQRFQKKMQEAEAIATILMTGNRDLGSAPKNLDVGARDLLANPFGPDELHAQMFNELRQKHAELSQMHKMLAMGEARTRAILQSAHDGILTIDVTGGIESLNPRAEETFGWSQMEVVGRRFIEEMVAPKSRAVVEIEVERAMGAEPPSLPREIAGLRRNGQEFPMEYHLTRIESPEGMLFCAFVRDLTESKRLQMDLQQAQKLEAVGRLAAGIAHEINTPIQFIGDNTRFLCDAFKDYSRLLQAYRETVEAAHLESLVIQGLDKLAQELELDYLSEQIPRTLDRTIEGVQRVATIVRAMKEFAHPDQAEMIASDLNRAIQATLQVARNEYKYVAEVETDFGSIPLVTCHAGDLNQVFLNIVVNAAHAMEDVAKTTGKKGKLRVRTAQEDGAVVVSIQDTGAGISEQIREKIFDPFFTTKPVGRGTGQGLSIARNIVEKHRGSLTFETETGKGTTFFIRIPVGDVPRGEKARNP